MWFASPWGPYRHDICMQEMLVRLMLAWSGKDDEGRTIVWPYRVIPESLENVRAAQKRSEDGMEQYVNEQGKIAHRWKPGHGPQGG